MRKAQKISFGKRLIPVVFLLAILVSAVPALGDTYFIYNQWGGTWHDANKTRTDDSLMCWAASASDILAWGKWNTATYNTDTQIFQNFKDHWTNKLGYAMYAWRWWLNGTPPPNNYYAYIDVAGAGNYFPDANFSDYYTGKATTNIMPYIDQMMNNGDGVSLVLSKGSSSHAVTCWGFDYNLVNGVKNYTSLYITDSDDGVTALRNYAMTYNNGYYLSGGYSGWRVGAAYGLEGNFDGLGLNSIPAAMGQAAGSPAPLCPTWVLLAPALLLLLVVQIWWRRDGATSS
jgi:hypothetical protein